MILIFFHKVKTRRSKRMRKMKKWLALGLVLIMMVSMVGCGGGGDKGKSTEDVMKTAQEELAKVKSMKYDMSMDMNMSAGGQTIESKTTGEVSYNADPLAMQMSMTMDMGAQGKMDMLMYAAKEGDDFVMYMSPDNGANWGKQVMADAAQLEQYNAQDSMSLYLDSIDSFKEAGTEQINGSDAVRYDGVISNDAMNEVMEASGAAQQLTQYGITEEQAAEMYKDLGELPISIWIDKESSLPVKYEMDMTAMMQKIMTKVMETMGATAEDAGLTVDKMFISMTLYDFNNVDPIEIPEAAKAAQEMAIQ